MFGEFLDLFLCGLEAVQPDLVALSDFREVLSLVHVEDFISPQEILEELRRNMQVMLGLEEVVFRESNGVLVNLHCNHHDVVSLVQALILEKLKLHDVFLIMDGQKDLSDLFVALCRPFLHPDHCRAV